MAIFPPASALTLLLDGRQVPAYAPVYLTNGRVVGPIDPFLTAVAQTIAYDGGYVIFTREGHSIRVRMVQRDPAQLSQTYVQLVPLLRALGEHVVFDGARRTVVVTSPSAVPVYSPTPFDPSQPQAQPSIVFTPSPAPTERPVWNGPPRPRRTPIPEKAWTTPPPS